MKKFYNNERSDRQMFSTVCDECGQNCEVPFKPRGNKPIFCSQCFEDKGNNQGGERNHDGYGRDHKREGRYNSNNSDRRYSSGRDNYKDNSSQYKGNNNEEVVKELKLLNKKLSEVLHILAPPIKIRLPKDSEETEEALEE